MKIFPTIICVFLASINHAIAGDITLYEGNYCDEARLANYDSNSNYNDFCKRSGYKCSKNNDEIRSLRLYKSNRSTFWIALFDDEQDSAYPYAKAYYNNVPGPGYRLNFNRPFRNSSWILVADPRKMTEKSKCFTLARYSHFFTTSADVATYARIYRKDGIAGKVSKVQIGR